MTTYLCNSKGGPLGKVVDYVWKRSIKSEGLSICTCYCGLSKDEVVAEMPQPGDSYTAKYLRKEVRKLEIHDYCSLKGFQKAVGPTRSHYGRNDGNGDGTVTFYRSHYPFRNANVALT